MFAWQWSSIYLTIAWLVNVVFLIPIGICGLLGLGGRLADVSERENMVLGGVLLCLALAIAVNVVALPQKGVWRSRLKWGAYVANSALLLFAGIGWWRFCREHQLFLPPPPESLFLLAVGLMSLSALVIHSRTIGTPKANREKQS